MVLIFDGNYEAVARVLLKIAGKIRFVTAVEQNKCPQQIKITEITPHVRDYFRVTSYISTML